MAKWTFPEGDRDYLGRIQRLPPDVGPVPHDQHVVAVLDAGGFDVHTRLQRLVEGAETTPQTVLLARRRH